MLNASIRLHLWLYVLLRLWNSLWGLCYACFVGQFPWFVCLDHSLSLCHVCNHSMSRHFYPWAVDQSTISQWQQCSKLRCYGSPSLQFLIGSLWRKRLIILAANPNRDIKNSCIVQCWQCHLHFAILLWPSQQLPDGQSYWLINQ
jgi:hypothetical protein